MGGRGSGRRESVEKILKRTNEKITPIGSSIFLPNYSGIQKAALRTESALSGGADNLGNHIATQTISGVNTIMSGTISGVTLIGEGSGITGISGDNLGNHIATQTISGVNTIMSGTISGVTLIGEGSGITGI